MNLLNLLAVPFIQGVAYINARPSGGAIRRTLDTVQAVQAGETVEIQTRRGSYVAQLGGATHAPSVQAGMDYARQLTRSQCRQVRRQVKMEEATLDALQGLPLVPESPVDAPGRPTS